MTQPLEERKKVDVKSTDWKFAVTVSETEQKEAEMDVVIALFVGSTEDWTWLMKEV